MLRVVHVCLLSSGFALGCAGSGQQISTAATGPSAALEEFDPYTLNDDDFLLHPTALPDIPAPSVVPSRTVSPSPSRQIEGYRVQIAAVIDRAQADALQQRFQSQLQTLVYAVYDNDIHLYKVQAGNCRTPAEAEQLRDKVKSLGFQEAYVVRTPIEITDVQAAASRPQTTQGYRVQIFSASNRKAAEDARNQAREQLGRDDIFIDFEPPYFKVRVGNFKARNEAEKLMDLIKKKGYETPFVVQTQIQLSPR